MRAGRSSIACELCRRKKLKCSGERPSCQACRSGCHDCIYAARPSVARPSNARINFLEENNRRLQQSLDELKARLDHAPDSLQDVFNNSETHEQTRTYESAGQEASQFNQLQLPPEREIGPDTLLRFHGATSAVATTLDESNMLTEPSLIRPDDEEIERTLFGETARQRQLESLNSSLGKLDFDNEDPELANHLLTIFWTRQFAAAGVVYRPVFMRDMACAGPYFSKLLLNAMYFTAAKYTSRTEVRDDTADPLSAGRRHRRRFHELLPDHICRSDIPTIQALLLYGTSLFTWCDERSASWLYTGMAYNMVVDLGLHVPNGSAHARSTDRVIDGEVQRRVFWAAYGTYEFFKARSTNMHGRSEVTDKLLSLYQGRPARLREIDISLPMKFLDKYGELESFDVMAFTVSNGNRAPRAYEVSALEALCKLSLIMDRVLCGLYSEQSSGTSGEVLYQRSREFHQQIKEWRRALPPYLEALSSSSGPYDPPPVCFDLLAMYHSLTILLHRPFVSNDRLRVVSASTVTHFFTICAVAAAEIDDLLQVYQKLYDLAKAPYVLSYAAYVSATIHVRVAAQMGTGSKAYAMLQTSLDVLRVHQRLFLGPKRALRVIEELVERIMGTELDEDAALSQSGIDQAARPAPPTPGFTNASTIDGINDGSRPSYIDTSEFNDLGYLDLDMDLVTGSFYIETGGSDFRPSSWLGNETGSSNHFAMSMNTGYAISSDPLFGIDRPSMPTSYR